MYPYIQLTGIDVMPPKLSLNLSSKDAATLKVCECVCVCTYIQVPLIIFTSRLYVEYGTTRQGLLEIY